MGGNGVGRVRGRDKEMEEGDRKGRERKGREESRKKYAHIRHYIVQTAVLREQDSIAYLHVFDILGEISALDHLGLVTDPLLRGFVQLLVLIQ